VTTLTLVRHGKAAAGWGDDLDPGLDDVGRAQAATMAAALAGVGPLPIVVSPLRRTRETATPLEDLWGVTARVDPAVGEIESPSDGLGGRDAWLRGVMKGGWRDVPEVAGWRQQVIDALTAVDTDTVVVTHFVAINVAVGHALGEDRVVCFVPDNCSRTVLRVAGGGFSVVELGHEVTSTRVT
jgi:broad specificity phosphatase PhoE